MGVPRTNSDERGGASAGETVLIDSEEPPSRRSKSLVDPLLDFSPSRSSLFIPASARAFYERVLAISVTCAPPFPSPFQTSSTAIIPFASTPPPLHLVPFIIFLLILLSLSLFLLFLFFRFKQIRLRSRHRCKVSTVRLKESGPPWVNVYPRLKSNEPPPCGVAYKVCPGY